MNIQAVTFAMLAAAGFHAHAADLGSLLKGVEKLKGQAAVPAVPGIPATGGAKASAPAVQSPAANNVELPRLHFDHPDIAWRIGDPVQVFEKDKWYVGTIANLDYDQRPVTVRMELYETLRWWPWKEIKPVDGHAYAKFPAAPGVGTEDAWNPGDRVEIQYFWGDKFHWKPGVVVSVDGDNYYVYAPGDTNKYFWRHKARVRNPGSAKEGWLANQPDPSGLVAKYQSELSARGCGFGSTYVSWPFLWYYDHSFGFEDQLFRMTPESLKSVLENYECYAKARQNFPELPITGGAGERKIVGRFDVQGQMIARHKEIIQTAVSQFVKDMMKPTVLKETRINGDFIPRPLAMKNGFEELKKQINASAEKYKAIADVVGASVSPDWDEVRKIYDAEVEALNARATASDPSLKNVSGYTVSFAAHNPAIEKKASAFALSTFPGAKILATAMPSSDMEIIKHNNGLPNYRYVYIAALMRHSDYRHCFKYAMRYKEDYAGGGKFSAGQVDKGHGATRATAIEEFTRCP
jgi:hypothetical protein